MVENFKRSEGSLYPVLHHTFKAKSLDSDKVVEYYVEDLTEKHYDEAFDFILKYLMPEETFQLAVRRSEKDCGVNILRHFYRGVFEEKVSLACFVSGSHELVGLNALKVLTKGHVNPIRREARWHNKLLIM